MTLDEIKKIYGIWSSDYEILLNTKILTNNTLTFNNSSLYNLNQIIIEIYKNGYFINEITWFFHTSINNPLPFTMGGIKDVNDKNFYYAETCFSKQFTIEDYNNILSFINNFFKSNKNEFNKFDFNFTENINKFFPCISIQKAFIQFVPNKYKNDEQIVFNFLNSKNQVVENKIEINSIMTGVFCYKLDDETMTIPYRNYYESITESEYNKFNDLQKIILDCIMTLNSNGYIREQHLKNILKSSFDFVEFFIFNLTQSYVIELLNLIYEKEKNNKERYSKFIFQNKSLVENGYQRMLSYWNQYYKSNYPNLKEYVGYKIFREIFQISRNGKTKLN